MRGVTRGTKSVLPLAPEHGFLHVTVLGESKIRIVQLTNATSALPETMDLVASNMQHAPSVDTVSVVGLGVPIICLNPVQIRMVAQPSTIT